ncbi:GyrI-like domain-containing protein [Brevibacillus dissolubilis]|uniref:GyrI-like domain-containing protein n=1 Tax=Brevibacillus dissolubilis TaxID=1844116 RepID=UPI00111671F2|nr:GyrI-like domain-containing protein [Brevibacillus dissolubilis]
MEPRIVNRPEMTVAGISTRTTNAQEATGDGLIPKLWGAYYQRKSSSEGTHGQEPSVTYGVYTDYENKADGWYTMLIGEEAGRGQEADQDSTIITIPSATYAVFTSKQGPVASVVPETWQQVWEWDEQHGKRAFTGDFERYDERSADPMNAIVEIYVAIKE